VIVQILEQNFQLGYRIIQWHIINYTDRMWQANGQDLCLIFGLSRLHISAHKLIITPDGSLWDSSVRWSKCRNCIWKWATIDSFHILSSSLFLNNPNIQRYITWNIKRIVKGSKNKQMYFNCKIYATLNKIKNNLCMTVR
jgi:hypothetical protein